MCPQFYSRYIYKKKNLIGVYLAAKIGDGGKYATKNNKKIKQDNL